MPANPLISQGVLQRLRASVFIIDHPELNVTPSFLGRDMVRLALVGDATSYTGTATGAVPSPEPYQMVNLTMHLLKTQSLADAYKRQQETNTLLGNISVTTDAATLGDYALQNCAITGIGELNFAGAEPGYQVTIGGYYIINSNLWN